MKKKKRFTLLEVILSLSLIAFLFSSLFYWYTTLTKNRSGEDKYRADIKLERELDRHLNKILSKADGTLFFTEHAKNSPALLFTFDNGAHLEPLLSGTVLGKIYRDEQTGSLRLRISPWSAEEDIKEPFLDLKMLENTPEVSFEFYYPPDLFKKPVNPDLVGKPNPKEGWQKDWSAEYKKIPALMKLTILKNKKGEKILLGYCMDPKIHPLLIVKPQKAV